jgi:WD40 repeat protein
VGENQFRLGFPFLTRPSEFDPSKAGISFYDAGQKNGEGLENFLIFADNYFLGSTELINPLQVICDRSADGLQIVFSDWQIFPTEGKDRIYLFDLRHPNLVSLHIPETIIFRINFSPDNHSVAVVGYDGLNGQDKFYLVDVETRNYVQLPIPTGFVSIAWSPDSSQIAVIDRSIFPHGIGSSSSVHVYNAQTGDLIDKVITDGIPPEISNFEIPLEGWTAEFQFPLQDLSTCISPP